MTRYYAVYAMRPGAYVSPMCFSTSLWRDTALFTARSLLVLGVPCWLEGIDYDGEIPTIHRALRRPI